MEYRTLGKTREKISTIGIGAWRIGSYGSQAEKEEQIRAIHRGLDLGINLIDTAEIYGGGRSEQLIGEAIKDKHDSVFLATKVSAEHLGREAIVDACDASLKRLGVRFIDLYQIHWPNPRIPIRETMAGMEKLIRDGKVRYVGVSNFDARQVDDARMALTKSDLVSNQVEYSIANRFIESELLPFCRDERITVIAYSPLARGDIPRLQIPKTLSDKYRLTTAQFMLSWVTRHEGVVAIPKAAQTKHMEENALSISTRLTQEEYDSVSGISTIR